MNSVLKIQPVQTGTCIAKMSDGLKLKKLFGRVAINLSRYDPRDEEAVRLSFYEAKCLAVATETKRKSIMEDMVGGGAVDIIFASIEPPEDLVEQCEAIVTASFAAIDSANMAELMMWETKLENYVEEIQTEARQHGISLP